MAARTLASYDAVSYYSRTGQVASVLPQLASVAGGVVELPSYVSRSASNATRGVGVERCGM